MVSLSVDVPGKNALKAKIGTGITTFGNLIYGTFFISSINALTSSITLLHFLKSLSVLIEVSIVGIACNEP